MKRDQRVFTLSCAPSVLDPAFFENLGLVLKLSFYSISFLWPQTWTQKYNDWKHYNRLDWWTSNYYILLFLCKGTSIKNSRVESWEDLSTPIRKYLFDHMLDRYSRRVNHHVYWRFGNLYLLSVKIVNCIITISLNNRNPNVGCG